MGTTQSGQLMTRRPLLAAVLLIYAAALLSMPAAAGAADAAAAAPVRVIVRLSEMPAAMADDGKQQTSGALWL
jgi:hypothetical protein